MNELEQALSAMAEEPFPTGSTVMYFNWREGSVNHGTIAGYLAEPGGNEPISVMIRPNNTKDNLVDVIDICDVTEYDP